MTTKEEVSALVVSTAQQSEQALARFEAVSSSVAMASEQLKYLKQAMANVAKSTISLSQLSIGLADGVVAEPALPASESAGTDPATVSMGSPIDQDWQFFGAPTILAGNDTIPLFKSMKWGPDVRRRQIIQPGWRSGILGADSPDPSLFLELDWERVHFMPALTGWYARLRRTRGILRNCVFLGTRDKGPLLPQADGTYKEATRDRHGAYCNVGGGMDVVGCVFDSLGGNPLQFVARERESAIATGPVQHSIRHNVFRDNAWNQFGHGGGAGGDITLADALPKGGTRAYVEFNVYDSGFVAGGDRSFLVVWAPEHKGFPQPRGWHDFAGVYQNTIVSRGQPDRALINIEATLEVNIASNRLSFLGWTPGDQYPVIQIDGSNDPMLTKASKVTVAPHDAPGWIYFRKERVAMLTEGFEWSEPAQV